MEIPYSSLPGVPRSNGFLSANYYSRNNPYDGSSYYTDETEEEVKMLFNNSRISSNFILHEIWLFNITFLISIVWEIFRKRDSWLPTSPSKSRIK